MPAAGARQWQAMTQIDARPHLALIAAIDRHRAIGRNGDLLWQNKLDQQHFRQATMGCPVIMGRKTWDSLPPRFRPLPGRRNIVVTGNRGWQSQGAEAAGSLQAALDLVADAGRVFVIGGGQLYAQALPQADELVLTEIDTSFERADTFFPVFDRASFRMAARDEHVADDGTRFAFVRYVRL
jgi:dihydrofolate reductase